MLRMAPFHAASEMCLVVVVEVSRCTVNEMLRCPLSLAPCIGLVEACHRVESHRSTGSADTPRF